METIVSKQSLQRSCVACVTVFRKMSIPFEMLQPHSFWKVNIFVRKVSGMSQPLNSKVRNLNLETPVGKNSV